MHPRPVHPQPLGTGNDLARVLGWGKSIRLDGLGRRLQALDSASATFLDRWRVQGRLPEGGAFGLRLRLGLRIRLGLRLKLRLRLRLGLTLALGLGLGRGLGLGLD